MFELNVSNAAGYLASQYECDRSFLRVEPLGGGISNTVLLLEGPGVRLVLKQSLGKLRVEQDWFSDRKRIFRECAALRILAPHLPPGAVPEVLFEDRENCLFAMTAAPPQVRTWKSLLLEGEADLRIAERIARMQAVMIRVGLNSPELQETFADQTVFDQLRLDPYYRATANRHSDLKPFFKGLVEGYANHSLALVHGDWSPKNFLIDGESAMAIDFEVIHFGDPAFDSAFLLNHLLLKSFHLTYLAPQLAILAGRYWTVLTEDLPLDTSALEARTVRHLGALLLARVDGKSPAEYLRDESVRASVRRTARELILSPPSRALDAFGRWRGL